MYQLKAVVIFCALFGIAAYVSTKDKDYYDQRDEINPIVLYPKSDQEKLNIALFEAARQGNTAELSELLNKGADPNYRRPFGIPCHRWKSDEPEVVYTNVMTVLMAASAYGEAQSVRILLDRGAEINAVDTSDDTALTWASRGQKVANVRELIKNKPDVNHRAHGHSTALDWAMGDEEIVPLLRSIGGKSSDELPRAR